MFIFDCWWTCRKASTKVLGLELPLLCNVYIRQFYIPQYSTQIFPGNTDRDTVVYHDLNPVIDARFVRVLPMEWFDFIGMRMELYSCQGKLLVNLFIPGWIIVLNFQKWSTWIFSLWCPYLTQQTGYKNIQTYQVEVVILVLYQIPLTNLQGYV